MIKSNNPHLAGGEKRCDLSSLLFFFSVLLSARCRCILPLRGSPSLCRCAHHRSAHKDIAADCRLEKTWPNPWSVSQRKHMQQSL